MPPSAPSPAVERERLLEERPALPRDFSWPTPSPPADPMWISIRDRISICECREERNRGWPSTGVTPQVLHDTPPHRLRTVSLPPCSPVLDGCKPISFIFAAHCRSVIAGRWAACRGSAARHAPFTKADHLSPPLYMWEKCWTSGKHGKYCRSYCPRRLSWT